MRVWANLLRILCLCVATAATPAELLMLRRAGCPWCAAWDRAIGPVYEKTEIGRSLPLRMVDLDSADLPPGLARAVRYTPSFILMADGHEIGRIEGYPGEDFFWGVLEKLVRSRPESRREPASPEPLAAR